MSAGLLLASCAAFSATMYAVASCRFLELTFETDQGSFENHFSTNPAVGQPWNFFRASVGLFQWLRPVDTATAWDEGSCVGYQESMLAVIQDDHFDMARSFGVIAVLMGLIASLWTFVTSCIAWNWLQLLILRILLFVGFVTSAMSFIILKADMCHDAIPSASCKLDEGGMVLIAAIILWLSAFLIAVVFFRPFVSQAEPSADRDVEKARLAGARAAQRAQRARQDQHERRQAQLAAMARSAAGSPPQQQKKTPSSALSPRTPDTNIIREESFDSTDSINSFENRQRGVRYLAEQQQSGQKKTPSVASSMRTQRSVALTVDDVSSRNELEVYINEKMSRIKHLMDLSTLEDDTSAEI